MPKLRIEIDLDNAVFDHRGGGEEVMDRLLHVAEEVRMAFYPGRQGTAAASIRDSNGNRVGCWEIE